MPATVRKVTILAVVGSGAMGAGIAQIAITVGFKTILFDLNQEALKKASKDIEGRLRRLVEKGRMKNEEVDKAMANLLLAPDLKSCASAEIVIEAIIENLEVKQKLFAELESILAGDAVIASNTSSLSIAAIASPCKSRQRICGMHFFNPVPLMRLVEIIRAPATNDETAAIATDVGKRLGKTTVAAPDAPGFLVNLGGRAYTTEALQIVQEGVADVVMVDHIMRDGIGFRMGPFELMDLTGIDVNFPATRYMYEGYQHDPRLKTTTLHESLFNAGMFGRKAGAGYHSYTDGTQQPVKPATTAPGGDPQKLQALVAEPHAGFETLAKDHGLTSGNAGPILVSPQGEDAATAAVRLAVDPSRVVAVDFTAMDNKFITLMKPLGAPDTHIKQVETWQKSQGFTVATVKDSPGFVAPRMLAMIAIWAARWPRSV